MRSPHLTSLICALLITLSAPLQGCDTPLNDEGLEPALGEQVEGDERGADAEEPEAQARPRSGREGEGDERSAADEGGEAEADAPREDDSALLSCDASEACLSYWRAFSECGVRAAGPRGRIDPSVYTENCLATCELADQLDYVGHYACLSDGIPEDCAREAAVVPECDI